MDGAVACLRGGGKTSWPLIMATHPPAGCLDHTRCDHTCVQKPTTTGRYTICRSAVASLSNLVHPSLPSSSSHTKRKHNFIACLMWYIYCFLKVQLGLHINNLKIQGLLLLILFAVCASCCCHRVRISINNKKVFYRIRFARFMTFMGSQENLLPVCIFANKWKNVWKKEMIGVMPG